MVSTNLNEKAEYREKTAKASFKEKIPYMTDLLTSLMIFSIWAWIDFCWFFSDGQLFNIIVI